jgi:hypothetical protein
VHGRPDRIPHIGPTRGRQDASLDELVKGGIQMVQWTRCGVADGGVVLGRGERGVKEARLGSGELEVRPADGAQPASGAGWRTASRAHAAHPVGHALSQSSKRGVADSPEESVTVGKMPVGGIGDDPGHARHFAEHNRVWSPGTCELEAGLDECSPHGAPRTRSTTRGPISRQAGLRLSCWHSVKL